MPRKAKKVVITTVITMARNGTFRACRKPEAGKSRQTLGHRFELESWDKRGILHGAATGAQAPALKNLQMPLVRLGPHQGNPFPSLTLVVWILSKLPELACRALVTATSMRHNPTYPQCCTRDTSLAERQVIESKRTVNDSFSFYPENRSDAGHALQLLGARRRGHG